MFNNDETKIFLENDDEFILKARALRPFYFIVVCWGETYTNFLFNFCIPSLLAPHNLPSLYNQKKNKFLIATTDKDWQLMQTLASFHTLKQYAEPVHVPIPACPEGESSCVHMGIGHKRATQIAFNARAYSILLTPDLMLSDGTMAAVQRHAVSGIEVVLVAALRFGEEPLFKNLDSLGIVSRKSRFGDEGKPINVSGRQLVSAGIKSFHSETLRYEWDASYFSIFPVACWWHVPEEDGVLVHCLSWAPLLVDYNAIEHHDSSMLDNWTIDGDYVYKNFGLDGNVYVVQDSDEAMLVSWAPLGDREQSLDRIIQFKLPVFGQLLKGMGLNKTFLSESFDPLKRCIFYLPVYWHSKGLNKKWGDIELKAQTVLHKFLPQPKIIQKNYSIQIDTATNLLLKNQGRKSLKPDMNFYLISLTFLLERVLLPFFEFTMQLERELYFYWNRRDRIKNTCIKALAGDKESIQKFKTLGNYLLAKLTGKL
jgi:hypothetical protein